MARCYNQAFDICSLCTLNGPLNQTQLAIFESLPFHDMHPDACACRLKLYECTIIRASNQEFMKPMFEDALRYAKAFSHVSIRLRLDLVSLEIVFRQALSFGLPKLKKNRMALTHGKEKDFSTHLEVAILEAFLYMNSSTSINSPQAKPLHGGGGWHRLKSMLSTKLSGYIQTLSSGPHWKFRDHVPNHKKSMKVSFSNIDRLSKCINTSLDEYSPDATFSDIYSLVSSSEGFSFKA